MSKRKKARTLPYSMTQPIAGDDHPKQEVRGVSPEHNARNPQDVLADASLPHKILQAVAPLAAKNHKREVYVRPMNNGDMPLAMKWWASIRDSNHFDERVIQYKSTAFWCAYEQQAGPLLYVPIQTAWMLDALGPNPLASAFDLAESLKQIVKVLHFKARESGIGEIYFPCDDKEVNKLALAHGFEEIGYPVLRLRVL